MSTHLTGNGPRPSEQFSIGELLKANRARLDEMLARQAETLARQAETDAMLDEIDRRLAQREWRRDAPRRLRHLVIEGGRSDRTESQTELPPARHLRLVD